MQNPITNPDYEPVALGGMIQVLLLAVWGLVLAFGPNFGVEFTSTQTAAVTGFIAAIEVLITKQQRAHAWSDEYVQAEFIRPTEDVDHWSQPLNSVQDYS